jgi:hypothetical protein
MDVFKTQGGDRKRILQAGCATQKLQTLGGKTLQGGGWHHVGTVSAQ